MFENNYTAWPINSIVLSIRVLQRNNVRSARNNVGYYIAREATSISWKSRHNFQSKNWINANNYGNVAPLFVQLFVMCVIRSG